MSNLRVRCSILLALIVALFPWPAAAGGPFPLSAPPLGERFFSISMNGEKTGFARVVITPAPDGYLVESDGSVKMRVLGFSRQAASHESYRVGKNLALRTFDVEERIDDHATHVHGEVTPEGVQMTVEMGGVRQEKLLKENGAVYPGPVLNLYPLMRRVVPGKRYRVKMLDVESLKLKEVAIDAVGFENLPSGERALHLRNDLYPFVDNDIWVDLAGNTIRESVRDDLIVTAAEPAEKARRFIAEAAIAKKDLILDFSLVPATPPIERPLDLKRLVVDVTGFPPGFPLWQEAGQSAIRLPDETVRFTVERAVSTLPKGKEEAPPATYLEGDEWLPVAQPGIIDLARQITAGETAPAAKVAKLVAWVAANIKDAVTDSPSPLDTLTTRSGNCQSHARLYTALARSAGIPTRFVSGLVYVAERGFLYHSWAESYVDGWRPVDPTFGQVPADASHIVLLEGESPESMAPVAGIVGRLSARTMEQGY